MKNDASVNWSAAYAATGVDIAYVWCASWFIAEAARELDSCEYQRRALLIWRKQHFAFSRGAYHWQHEPCWYAVRKGHSAKWCGDRTQSTVWDIQTCIGAVGKHHQSDEIDIRHSTQKPVECMARPMRNHGAEGDVVYDPFLGSGTSVIAAEQTERVCCGLEIDPAYCDVIVERWEQFTGGKARRG